MSKMSWLHAELSEKASELGFESLEEAERNGYEISMDGMTPTLKPNADKQLELAHNDWLKRKEKILAKLKQLSEAYKGAEGVTSVVEEAIEFIKRGET